MIIYIMLMVMLYTFAGGAVGRQVNAIGASKCNHKNHNWEDCGHYYTGILGGAFWFLALPIAAGMKTGDKVPTPINKEIAEDKVRQAELKRIQHEAEMEQAELMREEMLNRRLSTQVKHMELESKRMELTAKGVPDFEGYEPGNEDEPRYDKKGRRY